VQSTVKKSEDQNRKMMSENGDQEIDMAQLMARIRESAAKRKSSSLIDASATLYRVLKSDGLFASSPASATSSEFSRSTIPVLNLQPEFEPRERYHIEDLLVFNDQTFVRNAYRAILKREPDDAGLQYLDNIRNGRLSKIDVLARLRFSREGRLRDVKIQGLTAPALFGKLYRVPVLGYLVALTVGLVRLPILIANYRRLEAYWAAQYDRLAEHIDLSSGETQRKIADLHHQQISTLFREQRELTEDQNKLKSDISGHLGLTQNQFKEQALIQEKSAIELLELKSFIESNITQRLQQTRMELVLQERRLTTLLEEARKRLPEPFDSDQLKHFVEQKDLLLESLYSSLEDQFRGTREDIKERLRIYLPILSKAGATSEILDVGCGRGEWLEVLKEAGYSARGIDNNRIMVEQCSELGLNAGLADAITYLQSLADGSLNCLTAFHVAEHLPLETLLSFLTEVVRTLRPGGLVILETPNPENVLVGSFNFYLDPTHRNPIPSATMKFLLESRGFSRLEVLKLHPMVSKRLKGKDELSKHFNEYFFGPMDYAIVGRKV
jgi:2-polyprenyl-3-methyl-5-hydroxy-6-metoxy-1,4-benzoquinol methylase